MATKDEENWLANNETLKNHVLELVKSQWW